MYTLFAKLKIGYLNLMQSHVKNFHNYVIKFYVNAEQLIKRVRVEGSLVRTAEYRYFIGEYLLEPRRFKTFKYGRKKRSTYKMLQSLEKLKMNTIKNII